MIPVKMALGGASSVLGYAITNAIQGQYIRQKGLFTSFICVDVARNMQKFYGTIELLFGDGSN